MPPLLAPCNESTYYDVPKYKSEYKSGNDVLQYILKQGQVGMSTPHEPLKPSRERLDKLFNNLDLSGTEEWDEYDQQRVGELIKKYYHMFALEDTELGCTDIGEHETN